VPRKKAPSDSERICITFTLAQLEAIKQLVDDGKFGGTTATVVKEITLKYLYDQHLIE
jgi:hypothetical protein